KIRVMRPFPNEEIIKSLARAKSVAVLDRSMSFGNFSPVFTEVKSALYGLNKKPSLYNYVYGIGGRNIGISDVEKVFNNLIKKSSSGSIHYIGLRK
ncbi:MAG: hypothetical protein KAQ90_02415, partial [Melioribacteraceae bacterium]|nr:hypothetical protein [Melioribacteraceae bacterium]